MAIKTFTTGEVLTAANTNTYLANAGLVYVKEQTFNNVAAVQIDNCFSSTYDNYRVTLNIYSAQSALPRYGRFRFVQGTTPFTTGYFGKSLWNDIASGSTTYVNQDNATDGGCTGPLGYLNTGEGSYDLDIHSPFLAKPTRAQMQGQGLYVGAYYTGVNGWTLQTNSISFLGLYFYANGNNISGDVTIFGYRKA